MALFHDCPACKAPHAVFSADPEEECGECQKAEGQKKALSRPDRAEVVRLLRDAVQYRSRYITAGVTIEDGWRSLLRQGYDIASLRDELGSAAGSVFKTGDWRQTGDYVKSSLFPAAHARMLGVWVQEEE